MVVCVVDTSTTLVQMVFGLALTSAVDLWFSFRVYICGFDLGVWL